MSTHDSHTFTVSLTPSPLTPSYSLPHTHPRTLTLPPSHPHSLPHTLLAPSHTPSHPHTLTYTPSHSLLPSQRRSPRPTDEERSFTELTERCSSSPHSPPSPQPVPPKPDTEIQTSLLGRRKLEILKGISMYFNPRQLIGIMGPSG